MRAKSWLYLRQERRFQSQRGQGGAPKQIKAGLQQEEGLPFRRYLVLNNTLFPASFQALKQNERYVFFAPTGFSV